MGVFLPDFLFCQNGHSADRHNTAVCFVVFCSDWERYITNTQYTMHITIGREEG